MEISEKSMKLLLKMQQNETDEAATYRAISAHVKKKEDKEILLKLANEEATHALIWEQYTKKKLKVNKFKVFRRKLTAIIFGFTFAIKLMEKGEGNATNIYATLFEEIPESKKIAKEEEAHEQALIAITDEERLKYVGSMVLGLSDALVELTGTLAGLSFALQNTKLIALSGLITGISATLSMAASEFMAARSEGRNDALKSCLYTGIAYLITVALLVLPYLLLPTTGYLAALIIMLFTVVLIIAVFNYYIAVAKDMSFKKRFFEMAGISIGVAVVAFVIGLLVKTFLGIDV